jgi:repressor LexA
MNMTIILTKSFSPCIFIVKIMGRKKLLTKDVVLEAINQWLIKTGTPPTVDELRKSLGVGSTRTVLRYLEWLEENGDIERWPGARGLRPLRTTNKGLETQSIPLVGTAPGGPFMLAEENLEGWVRLPKEFLKPSAVKFFLLRVKGHSMNRARIHGDLIEDGDLVLVRQQRSSETGNIVVALIDGEATIKRLLRGAGYFVLKPESTEKEYQPIVVDKDFQVQGIVTRVLKKGTELINIDE